MVHWDGPDGERVILTDLKIGTAEGGNLQPSTGRFGNDDACFQPILMPGSCLQKFYQQQSIAFFFVVDNYTSGRDATAYLAFESREEKGIAKLLIRAE